MKFEIESCGCGGCFGAIRRSLMKLPSVNSVDVCIERRIVTVMGEQLNSEEVDKKVKRWSAHALREATKVFQN